MLRSADRKPLQGCYFQQDGIPRGVLYEDCTGRPVRPSSTQTEPP